jgi:uncharacterized protein RhaS with RHS repeats
LGAISTDPNGYFSGDYNLYRYTANNPLTNTDPSGLAGQALANLVNKVANWVERTVRIKFWLGLTKCAIAFGDKRLVNE